MKRSLLLAVLFVNLLHGSIASAQEVRTLWTPIEKSMTALLNEGWRVSSHAEVRAVDSLDIVEVSFSFVLMRESKVVICLISKPQPNNATSRCRALN